MDSRTSCWQFEGFRVDPLRRSLIDKDGHPVTLTSKAFDVLVYLIENVDRVVGKSELLDEVWRGRVVEENNLTQAISMLRKSLGTGAGDRKYIVTVPGRGYRFVASLQEADTPSRLHESAERDRPSEVVRGILPARAIAWGAGLIGAFVVIAAALFFTSDKRTPVPGSAATLAIMPFRAVSEGESDDLLALGLAETLITRLSATGELTVVSFNSSARASRPDADPFAVGRALGATHVLDGSTQGGTNLLRINARLLDLAQGEVIWAATHDSPPGDLFQAQDDIAVAVAMELTGSGIAVGTRSPCDGGNSAAYRAYLTGYHILNAPTPQSLPNAVASFRNALDLDPLCARAWAGQAFAWRALSITGDMDPKDVMPLAKEAVRKALELDPGLAEAYTSRGFIEFWFDWNWDAAEASMRRAIELNSNLAQAHLAHAHLLSNLGRFEESLISAEMARELDPLSPLINALEASFLHVAGADTTKYERIERAISMAPRFWIAYVVRGTMELDDGNPEAAVVSLESAAEFSSRATQALALLGVAYVRTGRLQQAKDVLAELEIRDGTAYVPPTSIASVVNALGDQSRALDLLETAYQARDLRMTWLKIDRRWDNLRDEPQFQALMVDLGLDGS